MTDFIITNINVITIVLTLLYFMSVPYKETVEGNTRSLLVASAGFLWGVSMAFADLFIYPLVVFYALKNGIGQPILGWLTAVAVAVTWLKNLRLIKKKNNIITNLFYFAPNMYMIYIMILKGS